MKKIHSSVILVDYSRSDVGPTAFMSAITQRYSKPYEVILLCCHKKFDYSKLVDRKASNCTVKIKYIEPPNFLNVAAFKNYGVSLSSGRYLFPLGINILYKSNFLEHMKNFLNKGHMSVCVQRHGCFPDRLGLRGIFSYDYKNNFDADIERCRLKKTTKIYKVWIAGIRRDFFIDIGGYNSDLLMHEAGEIRKRVVYLFDRSRFRKPGIKSMVWAPEEDYGFIFRKPTDVAHQSTVPKDELRKCDWYCGFLDYQHKEEREESYNIGKLVLDRKKLREKLYTKPTKFDKYSVDDLKQLYESRRKECINK